MSKFLQFFFGAISLMAIAGSASGQPFSALYPFTNVGTGTGRTDPTPSPVVPGITFGSFVAVAPADSFLSINPNAAGRFSFTGWPRGATAGSDIFAGTIDPGSYYQVTITPQVNTLVTIDSIGFALQRSTTGIRQYAVRSSIDNFASNLPASIVPANASLQVVSVNTFQVTEVNAAATDGSRVMPSSVAGIATPVTFRFYGFNARASGGTFSIDNVRFIGSASAVQGSPVITLDTTSFNFSPTNIGTSSAAKMFHILGENLAAPVTISTVAPFSISDAENGTYTTSLVVNASDVAVAKAIYVKINPASIASFNGTVNVVSGVASKSIAVAGDGIDPANLSFNFNTCSAMGNPGSGFISYSVTGAQKWACSAFGNNTSNGVDINGYVGGAAMENEDWLISPALGIGSLNLPILSFYSRGQFTGPSLQLLISTDYDGSSNPNTATWTDLQANFPPLTNTWTFTDGINLTSFKSFAKIYLAFKYTSSIDLGAARWSLDDVNVNDRSKLLSVSPAAFNFGEVSAGNNSTGQTINVQAIGYGDVVITAPSGYQVSLDNVSFASSVHLNMVVAEAGTQVYARFSPAVKMLKLEGKINFKSTGLDSNYLALTGTSYPRAETFDAGAYNLSFFGSNATNNPTPQKITTQVNNIATVVQHLNLDVIGIEEMSSDSALGVLISKLPNYAAVISDRWSYSFNGPDPAFPPQKTGFIYNTTTMQLIDSRVMFVGLYDSVRNGTSHALDNYPTGTSSSFWASGRLPFMATFSATIGGVTKLVRMIDIHAKSASDVDSYNRRVYDIKVLKDSLDAYYKNDNVILVGDYNDRVIGSINAGAQSPYKVFVDDKAGYAALTYPLDSAGRVSFLSGTAMIDHIIISNRLLNNYIAGSADIEDPRTYVPGYNANTASDHLPVLSRFLFDQVLPVKLTAFNAQSKAKTVSITWSTASEVNNGRFIVERSADGRNFIAIASVKGAATSNAVVNYQLTDSLPLRGTSYYRLAQVDIDGKATMSDIVSVTFFIPLGNALRIYPNPVTNSLFLSLKSAPSENLAQVLSVDGIVLLQCKGSIEEVGLDINRNINRLKSGVYIFKITNTSGQQLVRFVKE
jgi:hypothetical protein